jgi:CRP-like cAMP-binding protein/glyoxylase-like metal-dependent hydrolase (beta-lactamase superfamily II)
MLRSAVESLFTIENLSRGGILVEGPDLRFQIGSYPETIKDTMPLPEGVPDLFVVPDELFDTEAGVSASDLEFPLYYNFYFKSRRCRFLCHRHQVRPLMRVLKEAVFGPTSLRLEGEYSEGREAKGFPDLAKEMAYYKLDPGRPGGRLRLKHMVDFQLFDDNGQAQLGQTTVTSMGRNRYRLEGHGESHECCLRGLSKPAGLDLDGQGYYQPPVFGVTMIGSGHGFDAQSKTSGFILWIDGKGVLVDPPVHTTEWMREQRINTRLIEDLILTHCHADHDSGTLQKILEEGRVRVHTTETVARSFVAKYSALTGLCCGDLRALFEFCPVTIGRPITLAGAKFLFRYTLHSIPTLGFEVELEGKSFYYSSDTLYDPDLIGAMHAQGVLSNGRHDELLAPPWDSSLILHEAGIPPVHTPLDVLASLPESVKVRMVLTHVSEGAISADSGLRLAQPGPQNTLEIDCPRPQKSLACTILDVVRHIDLFAEMSLQKAQDCVAMTELRIFEPGQVVIEKGTYGDTFFMIASGEVEVLHEDLPQPMIVGRYDYFGETAVITGRPRNADIVARTRTELLCVSKEDFLRLVRGTSLPETFQRLARNRSAGARWVFEKHRGLSALSPLQKNQLMCRMKHAVIPKGTVLFAPGDEVSRYYLVDSGEVLLSQSGHEVSLGPGTLVGELGSRFVENHHGSAATAATDLWVYAIDAQDMASFFHDNPGTFVRLAKRQRDTLRRGTLRKAG